MCFQLNTGISEHCSLEIIVTGQTVDHNEHCQHKFGTCVQAHHEPQKKNSVKQCTINTIHLWPAHDKQGGYKVMNSSTGMTLTHSGIVPTPLTQFVKNAVEAMAIKQGHTCLKFINKKGIKLGNSD